MLIDIGDSTDDVVFVFFFFIFCFCCFFFQAEDGIRDRDVTGFRRVLFRSAAFGESSKISLY